MEDLVGAVKFIGAIVFGLYLVPITISSLISYLKKEYFRKIPPKPRFSSMGNIDDVCDAYTGVPLEKHRGIYQCDACKSYYHSETLIKLKNDNQQLQCFYCKRSGQINKVM